MNRPLQGEAESLAARLPPLLLAAERVAATVAGGTHGRRRAGTGETFWQFRHAQAGDAQSAIDWRQSARSQGLFVRETEWAAAQVVGLWRDGSASMAWSSSASLSQKKDRAELLLLALAALLLKAGEKVALLSGTLPPTTGGAALYRLGLTLAAEAEALPPAGRLPRHAERVLVSDFLMPLPELERSLRTLAAEGGGGHLIQVLDPAEESLPYEGRIRFMGLEDEGEFLARRAEDLRNSYQRRLAAHRDGLITLARSLGWSFTLHHTDQPPQVPLLALHARLGGPRARFR
ncbi:MAG TPA: DUF58 domain-containing protein [Magnetospirillum sp.]|nr:DUF58 domain-containing protein [Magnetospirillum sp.]